MPYFLCFLGVLLGTILAMFGHYFALFSLVVVSVWASSRFRSVYAGFVWLVLLVFGLIVSGIRASGKAMVVWHLGDTCNGRVVKNYDRNLSVRIDSCLKSSGKGAYIYTKCLGWCPMTYQKVNFRLTSLKSFGKFQGEGIVVTVLSDEQKSSPQDVYYRLLRRFSYVKLVYFSRLREMTSSDVASLVTSMLFGETNISNDLKDVMKGVGMMHVVAISGVNISYLLKFYNLISKRFSYTTRKVGEWVLLLVLYLVVGEVLSLVRALLTLFWAVFIKRVGVVVGENVYWLSMSALLVLDPWNYMDVGYWLVFSACFGVFIVVPFITKKWRISGVRKLLVENLVVWGCVVPAQIIVFRQISVGSLVLMPVIGPLVEYVSILGYLGVVLLRVPIVSEVVSIVLGSLTAVILFVINMFHALAS
ncbi:MAG: ComEC/Rec2 family competence protein [Patescibacteria group bacterium]